MGNCPLFSSQWEAILSISLVKVIAGQLKIGMAPDAENLPLIPGLTLKSRLNSKPA